MSQGDGTKRQRFCRWDNPIVWGLVVTGLLAALILIVAFHHDAKGVSGATRFLQLKPNEMGDTIAGLFSSLAFVWIVVTVFIQSQELASQREELRLSREEAKRTADALGEQVKVLLDEQRQRKENRFASLLERRLDYLESQLRRMIEQTYFFAWLFDLPAAHQSNDRTRAVSRADFYDQKAIFTDSRGADLFFPMMERRLAATQQKLVSNENLERPDPQYFDMLDEIISLFDAITSMKSELSTPSEVRVATLRVAETKNMLEEIRTYLLAIPEAAAKLDSPQ